MACCMARSLNDAGKPAVVEESPTLNSETSALAKSKDVAADDIVEERWVTLAPFCVWTLTILNFRVWSMRFFPNHP